jgi:branched-subunit amino acid ABC-type transport system permease component
MGPIGLNVIVQGLLTGLVYGLMALGFSVIFRGMRVANFAHGALTVLAMYSAFLLFRTVRLDPLLAFVPIAAVFFGLGYLLQRLLVNPFLGRPQHQHFMLLAGLALVIANGLVLIFGPEARPVELSYRSGSYLVGPIALDKVVCLPALLHSYVSLDCSRFSASRGPGPRSAPAAKIRSAPRSQGSMSSGCTPSRSASGSLASVPRVHCW